MKGFLLFQPSGQNNGQRIGRFLREKFRIDCIGCHSADFVRIYEIVYYRAFFCVFGEILQKVVPVMFRNKNDPVIGCEQPPSALRIVLHDVLPDVVIDVYPLDLLCAGFEVRDFFKEG